MTLDDFLLQTQSEVREQINDKAVYPELVFAEIVMQHLADVGMSFEPAICHYEAKIGNKKLKLTGYAISEDNEQLHLFVSLYLGTDQITAIPDTDTRKTAEQCLRFLAECASGKMAARIEETNDAHSLALTIQQIYNDLEQVNIFVLTDGKTATKVFSQRDISGKSIKLEVMDIERLFRHWSEGKARDELVVNFNQSSGSPLPCVYVTGEKDEYDYALTAMPGDTLRFLYEKFGSRLLEANVRSFLKSGSRGVNAGIQKTLRDQPDRFMAYNNGIVIIADEIRIERTVDGSPGITWLRGMQIVNGGQTTASMYFTKKKYPSTDLGRTRVPAKIIILKKTDSSDEESLISDISRYANSQNVINQADLSANKPFHVEMERLSLTIWCPDGQGRWFYERARGSYNTLLAREGSTPAKLRQLRESVPASRKITKTDLAKYIMAWEQQPDVVSLGAQKCFEKFMVYLDKQAQEGNPVQPDIAYFKAFIAKAVIFRETHKIARPLVSAFLANVTAYTVSVISRELGEDFDLERVWKEQGISSQLADQIRIWAREVNNHLHDTANGRMISEWAKMKPGQSGCAEAVLSRNFSSPRPDIPEVRRKKHD
jgi:hypothetical protein